MVPRDLRDGGAGPQATGLKSRLFGGLLANRPRHLPLETDRALASVRHRYMEVHATRPVKSIVGRTSSEEGKPVHFDLERGRTVGGRDAQSGALQFPQREDIASLEAQLQKPTAVRGLHGVQHTEDRLVVSCDGIHMNAWRDCGLLPGTSECEPYRNARSVGTSCEALNLEG